MIGRFLSETIEDKLFKGKIIILLGARQVGKTTLLKQILTKKEGVLWLNGDEMQVQNLFNNASADRLLSEFGNNKIVILDEAQRITLPAVCKEGSLGKYRKVQDCAYASCADGTVHSSRVSRQSHKRGFYCGIGQLHRGIRHRLLDLRPLAQKY